MKRIFALCLCVSMRASTGSAQNDEPPGESQSRGPMASQAGGWSEFTQTTSGLGLEAVLKARGPDEAKGGATFYFSGTIAAPWARSANKLYLSNTEAGVSFVKVNGQIPPFGSNPTESESEITYDPPLLAAPKNLKVGGEWDDRAALSGHTKIDWHNPATPTYDGELSGVSAIHGRVTGKETVTVPAGRFECFVVDSVIKETYSYPSGWTGGGAAKVTSTASSRNWISPELGLAVKSKYTSLWSYASGGKEYPGKLNSSMALVRYKIDKPSETPAEGAATKKIASDVDAPKYSAASNPDDFALVIGISKYRDIPDAQFAERDAQAVKRHLLAMGYPEENILTLTGDHATKSAFEEKLEKWLPMNVNGRSTLFVYYSGHGAPDPESKEAYLVPWDGEPESLAATAFPLSRFYNDLNKLPAKRVLVALDSCFSGAGGRSVLAKGARPLVSKLKTSVPVGGKLVVFTASGSDQISGTLEGQGHGTFTYYFLKGLNGDAPAPGHPGHVTVGSLYGYLSSKVNAAAHRQEREQNPQLLPAAQSGSPIELR